MKMRFSLSLLSIDGADEVHQACHDVILEIFVVGDGQHVVDVGHEGHVRCIGHLGEIIVHRISRIGQHQALDVERVAAEHAAHGVGDKRDDLIALGAHVAVALVALGDLLGGVEDTRHRDVLVLDLDGHLTLHVVDLGEDAVELLLVGAELFESRVDLGFVSLVLVADEGCHAKPPFCMENRCSYQ